MKMEFNEVFQDTQNFYQEDPILAQSVCESVKGTRLYAADDYPVLPPPTQRLGLVRMRKRKTFQSATELCRAYPEKKIAVLNFASADRPGGGVETGSSTQEASLCRCSTLYPTLDQPWLLDSFYQVNQAVHDPLHSDACIYSPGVVICKSDDESHTRRRPESYARLEPNAFVTVDVISCAPPDLRPLKDGKAVSSDLDRLPRCRVSHIFHIAAANQVDVLVLGAFGCGGLANKPTDIRAAFETVLDKYRKWFDLIEFAVYCRDEEEELYKEKLYWEFRHFNNYHHMDESPTILDSGRKVRDEYGEAFGSNFLHRLTVEQLNALHSGKQLAIPVMGGEYILFLEGPAASDW